MLREQLASKSLLFIKVEKSRDTSKYSTTKYLLWERQEQHAKSVKRFLYIHWTAAARLQNVTNDVTSLWLLAYVLTEPARENVAKDTSFQISGVE